MPDVPLSAPPPAPPGALRVLIVDDEEPARWRMARLVADCPVPAVVAGEAASVLQARVWLAERPCDVLLLDIAMPGASGLELAEELRRAGAAAPAVIFVTAHAEHALQAFEVAATDYLTKPVRRERLQAALQRVADRIGSTGRPADRGLALPAGPDAAVLVVVDRGRLLRVPLVEVLYLKAELKYVTVRTAQQSLLIDESLAELEGRVGDSFLRVHRNALVARSAVRALERRALGGDSDDDESGESWAVRIAPIDEWLAVSRRQLHAVREALREAGQAEA